MIMKQTVKIILIDGSGSMGIHRKIDSPRYGGGSVYLIESWPDLISSYAVHGYQVNGAGQGQVINTVRF